MGIYNIAGIKIKLNFLYDTFFKHNIEKYLSTDNRYNYQMIVEEFVHLESIKDTPKLVFKNRRFHEINQVKVIEVLDENHDVRHRVEHTKDYKNIKILLKEKQPNNDEIEYIITGMMFLEIATIENFVALHGSAVVLNSQAVIFSAPSGTGKSTHANYWLKSFSEAILLNDDKPLICYHMDEYHVFSSPWSGKSAINENKTFPLKHIVFIEQGKIDEINELTKKDKMVHLLKNTVRPSDTNKMGLVLERIEHLINHVPMSLFKATNHISSVDEVYKHIWRKP